MFWDSLTELSLVLDHSVVALVCFSGLQGLKRFLEGSCRGGSGGLFGTFLSSLGVSDGQ